MIKLILRKPSISTNDKTKESEYNDILYVPYIQGFTENLGKNCEVSELKWSPKET